MTPEEAKTLLPCMDWCIDMRFGCCTCLDNLKAAILSEREACAKVVETIQFTPEQAADEADCHCALIAAAIRARSKEGE